MLVVAVSSDRTSSPNKSVARSTSDDARATKRSLLVLSPSGVFSWPLPTRGEVTIGRGIECDLRIDDSKASRRHVTLFVDDECAVTDLGSRNGTQVAQRPILPQTRVALGTGDAISIGSTVLVLQIEAASAAPARLWSQAAFEARVAEERAIATESGRSFAVVRVDLLDDDRDGTLPSTSTKNALRGQVDDATLLERAFRECLRPGDVIGATAPGRYDVLFSATDPDEASALAALLRRHLRDRGFDHAMRLARFPRDTAASAGDLYAVLDSPRADVDDEDEPPASVAAAPDFSDRLTPMMERIAAGEINVLILGETGVGKEVLAHAIHGRSPRRAHTMLCINCAALSETLLESELFGHERGAFTGATASKAGLLESANGSTVFLDEVGEMPLSLQAKLLRVLEQREVLRVGAVRPRSIDVRFLAATNRDLEAESAAGRFRRDLYFRLNGVSVVVPPLRDRPDDIAPLARLFVRHASDRAHRATPPTLAPTVLDLLQRYPWPGNVRELRNAMERAVLLTPGHTLTLESFPSELISRPVPAIRNSGSMSGAAPVSGPRDEPRSTARTLPPTRRNEPADARPSDGSTAPEPASAPPIPAFATANDASNVAITDDERAKIIAALEACGGNQTRAAQLLGVSRRTLVSRLTEYSLPRPRK
jgi:DNA-binding NtrC family response regulator